MLKHMWDLRTLCVAEHLQPQKRDRRKDVPAQSMSTGEMTQKHTKFCLVVSSRASSQAPPEVTLLPLSHSVILILAFFLLQSLHSSFLYEVRRCCRVKWYTWYSKVYHVPRHTDPCSDLTDMYIYIYVCVCVWTPYIYQGVFHACDSRTSESSFFKIFLNFVHFCQVFAKVLPFFCSFFKKSHACPYFLE